MLRADCRLALCPDVAVVCTPADTVPGLISELGAAGCRAVIVLSAGFSGSDHEALRQSLLDAAHPHRLRILGPNCIGLLAPGISLNASFAPGRAMSGKLAFVTQSGALATSVLCDLRTRLGERPEHRIFPLRILRRQCGRGRCRRNRFFVATDTRAILLYIEGCETEGS